MTGSPTKAQRNRARMRAEAIARANRAPLHRTSTGSTGMTEFALLLALLVLVMAVVTVVVAPELQHAASSIVQVR